MSPLPVDGVMPTTRAAECTYCKHTITDLTHAALRVDPGSAITSSPHAARPRRIASTADAGAGTDDTPYPRLCP